MASASAHSQFAAFWEELGASTDLATATLPNALDAIAGAGILKPEDLATGLDSAYKKADSLLCGNEIDENGLGRDEIATVHMYTQVMCARVHMH